MSPSATLRQESGLCNSDTPRKRWFSEKKLHPVRSGIWQEGWNKCWRAYCKVLLPQKKKWCLNHIPVCTLLHRAFGDGLSPHSFDIYWKQHMKPSRLSRVTYNYKAEGCDGPDSQGPFIQSNPKLSPNQVFFFMQTPVRQHIPNPTSQSQISKPWMFESKFCFWKKKRCFHGPMHAGGVNRACR